MYTTDRNKASEANMMKSKDSTNSRYIKII